MLIALVKGKGIKPHKKEGQQESPGLNTYALCNGDKRHTPSGQPWKLLAEKEWVDETLTADENYKVSSLIILRFTDAAWRPDSRAEDPPPTIKQQEYAPSRSSYPTRCGLNYPCLGGPVCDPASFSSFGSFDVGASQTRSPFAKLVCAIFGILWPHLLIYVHEKATSYRAEFKDQSPRSGGGCAVDGAERFELIVSEVSCGVLKLEGSR